MNHSHIDEFDTDKLSNTVLETSVDASVLVLSVFGTNALKAYEANTFLSRLRGLHAHLPMAHDEALLITPCNAIHTFGMPIAIDCIFIDHSGCVIEVKTVARRWWSVCRRAAAVIEVNAGVSAQLGIAKGVQVERSRGQW